MASEAFYGTVIEDSRGLSVIQLVLVVEEDMHRRDLGSLGFIGIIEGR